MADVFAVVVDDSHSRTDGKFNQVTDGTIASSRNSSSSSCSSCSSSSSGSTLCRLIDQVVEEDARNSKSSHLGKTENFQTSTLQKTFAHFWRIYSSPEETWEHSESTSARYPKIKENLHFSRLARRSRYAPAGSVDRPRSEIEKIPATSSPPKTNFELQAPNLVAW